MARKVIINGGLLYYVSPDKVIFPCRCLTLTLGEKKNCKMKQKHNCITVGRKKNEITRAREVKSRHFCWSINLAHSRKKRARL